MTRGRFGVSAAKHMTACLVLFALWAGAKAPAQQPLTLFNGTSLLGWNAKGTWAPVAGVLMSAGGQSRSVMTQVPFADFNLSFDYNESGPTGARLRLWAPHEEPGGSAVDLDISGASAGVGGVEGGPRSTYSSMSAGWHHVQVDAANGRLTVRVDGGQTGTSPGSAPRSGYLGWEANGAGSLQLRNIKLVPAGLTTAFDGVDLGAWKAVNSAPKSKGGLGHDVEKTLTLGIGGGNTKPHTARWTVQNGALHGEDGPGGLEYSVPVDDALIELSASLKGQAKPAHFTALNLRGTTGQLEGGYAVGVGPFSGSIENLAKHPVSGGGTVEETIVIHGRTIATWVGGNLATVFTDSRPDAAKVAQGAKTGSGSVDFVLPGDGVQLNVQHISITPLPRPGGPSATQQAAGGDVPAAGGVGGTTTAGKTAGGPASSPAEAALLQQQLNAQKQADEDRQAKQRVASLMALALATTDPAKQMDLYNQVVQLDPSNAPAVQGYKDAQTKLQTAQTTQEQQIATQVNQQHTAVVAGQQVNESLIKAQSAFLSGHISQASSALSVAERLDPGNPVVRELRSRISASSALNSRLMFLAGGAGLIALLGSIAYWIRRKRQQRFPMLEITAGMDVGQQFPLQKDLIRIGAVDKDGGQKNDIVVTDVDHLVSRFHCEIARKNGQLYLTDLKSSNGTRLEGTQLEPGRPMLLRRGNRILLADAVELRFGFGRSDAPKR